ncbi:MAG: pseudouridine-5'-phosphate glycosidase [Planctomycetota bacterium]
MRGIEIRTAGPRVVALETTVLTHGLPRERGRTLINAIRGACKAGDAIPAFTGLIGGTPIIGLDDDELDALLANPDVQKINTANLGIAMHRGQDGATTVSTTLELAAQAGIQVAATGGIGGVHRGYATALDISSDLAALARYPVAIVSSGAKSILDVEATREVLETLGVPVVGYRTQSFPAFFQTSSERECDARFDDERDLATFVARELRRTSRGLMIANPIPAEHEIARNDWDKALKHLERFQQRGRAATPAMLATIQRAFGERLIEANEALLLTNIALASRLAGMIPAVV